jgi:hypothetical protein
MITIFHPWRGIAAPGNNSMLESIDFVFVSSKDLLDDLHTTSGRRAQRN